MSDRTRKYLPILKRRQRLGEKAKKQFIKKCDMEFIDCVSECAKNIIKGNVPLNPAQLRRLCRERGNVKVLAWKKTSLKKKRRVLQKGGFLGALLPPFLVSSAVCCWAMQTAKKLVLVDPQFLEQLKVDREYKQIQKPADSIARTCESRYWQNLKRRYAVRRPKSRSLFADSEQILSGDRRSTTADDF